VRDNPDSLQKLLDLFNKAGETTHVGEVIELLAHASVQTGDLSRAKDLYQKLAQIEPQNPLHMQNFQQVVSQLGGSSGTKLITPEEAVVLIDDLEATAPSIHQHYSDEVALAIRSALTDAELFISYNMPAKALGPLVSALPMAPNDLRLNQRLAALHTRAGRFAEAAICCRTLQSIYSESDHPEEATRYGELAERYEERSSSGGRPMAAEEEHIFLDAEPKASAEAETEAPEFSIEEAAAEITIDEEPAAAEEEAKEDTPAVEAASPWPGATQHAEPAVEEMSVEPAAPEFEVAATTPAEEPEATSEEIDLSSEWDDSITVEADETPAVAEADEVSSSVGDHDVPESSKVDETIEEIRFYLAHSMPEQAMAALAKLQTLTRDQAKIAELRAEVEAATAHAAEEEAAAAEPVVEEIAVEEIPSFDVETEAAPEPVEEPVATTHEPVVSQLEVPEPAAKFAEPAAEEPVPVIEEEVPAAAEAAVEVEPEPVVVEPEPEPEPEPAPAHGVLKEFVTDLESSLGDTFLPGTVAKPTAPVPAAKLPAQPRVPAAQAAPPAAVAPTAPVLGEFVADIEASLGEDFLKAAPVPPPEPAAPVATARVTAPVAKAQPAAPIAAPKISSPLAASAAASASPSTPAASGWPAAEPAHSKPSAPPAVHAPAPAAAKSSPFAEDAGVDLAEMFGELKQDLEADVASADEDPETHYNLGIAFREMGLLDEAIGELQKACQSFDRGHPFPQIMQTYTWLAQCFLEKGVPEAAVRWYERALQVPTIDGETRTALNYELAAAYETAGDKPAALKHFMDVYGSNIDYRDVSERIKALKS